MKDSPTRIKIIRKGIEREQPETFAWGDILFITDASCAEYDWLVVYDEFPKGSTGTILRGSERLACPRERTILITVEPPNIKIYSTPYVRQFGYVLTTHPASLMKHPGHRIGKGCLRWFYEKDWAAMDAQTDFPKPETISVVCSSKQQKRTRHFDRYSLVRYLADHMPELQWFGHGVKPIRSKNEALDDFKYHIAIENYIADRHWTEKPADVLLAAALPFYAGDPKITEVLPPGSIIPIPLDNPPEALRIIREGIAAGEYEKRLPAILEARRLILHQYNMWAQVAEIVSTHQDKPAPLPGFVLKGRHRLRLNPLNALREGWDILRYKAGKLFGIFR